MNFEKAKALIDHTVKKFYEDGNPMYLANVIGMCKGILTLCDTEAILTKEERNYLVTTELDCIKLLLVFTLERRTENE